MENDTAEIIGSVELVSSEVSGYIGEDGTFKHGQPPVEVHVQTDEDVIEG